MSPDNVPPLLATRRDLRTSNLGLLDQQIYPSQK